jgi:hypothetical protein
MPRNRSPDGRDTDQPVFAGHPDCELHPSRRPVMPVVLSDEGYGLAEGDWHNA